MTTSLLSKSLTFAIVVGLAAGLATSAMAETQWEQTHPRRDQVNDRLQNQNRRIHHEVKEGDLTHRQAANLHRQDHQIRQEERAMASQDHGHITKVDQHALDQQENGVSGRIGQ